MILKASLTALALSLSITAAYAQDEQAGTRPPLGQMGESTRPVIDQLGDLGPGVEGSIAGPECSPVVSERLVEASTRAQKTRISLLTLFNNKTLRDFNCLDSIFDFEFSGGLSIPSLPDIIRRGTEAVCNIANDFIQENLAKNIKVTVPGIELPGGILIGGGGFEASTSFGSSSSSGAPRGVNNSSSNFEVPTFLPRLGPNGGDN